MQFDLRKTILRCLFILILCLAIVEAAPTLSTAAPAEAESPWLKVVREFGDEVLAKGRDRYGKKHTPLFVDGLNINTLEPVRWEFWNNRWIISNQASQQNLFRTLTALSNLTGDPKYKNAAKEAIDYMFKNHRSANGLLYWGGHTFIDLASDTRAYGFDANSHELKNHFPFYDLMWEVDPAATKLYLQAVWNAHIIDWSTLDMNRHGSWSKPMGRLWRHTFTDPEPFFEGDGLTFINAGTDLIYAAAMLYHYTGDTAALTWTNAWLIGMSRRGIRKRSSGSTNTVNRSAKRFRPPTLRILSIPIRNMATGLKTNWALTSAPLRKKVTSSYRIKPRISMPIMA